MYRLINEELHLYRELSCFSHDVVTIQYLMKLFQSRPGRNANIRLTNRWLIFKLKTYITIYT